MRLETNEVPPHLHPQASMEPLPPSAAHILQQDIPVFDEWSNDLMAFVWEEQHAVLPSETSSWYPTTHVDGSSLLPNHIPAYNFSSFRQNNELSKIHNALPLLNQPFILQQPAESSIPKRAPKAPTMSAKNWKPHAKRMTQLYVNERKSIEELREIMNKELGITATLRQYKVQIQQMKLERNVKAQERKAVVKHIQYRAHAVGKNASRVRVRGHGINQAKLLRWAKENLVDHPSISANPPSPLPSCISIYTNSVCETSGDASLAILKLQQSVNGFSTTSDLNSTFSQRLLRYAQGSKRMLESHEAREVFNDLQLLLRNDYTAGKRWDEDHWNVNVEENIIHVRNLMNLTQTLFVGDELRDTRELVPVDGNLNRNTDFSKVTNDHAAWVTPYGRLQVSFWTVPKDSNIKSKGDTAREARETVATRLAIVPSNIGTSPFRVIVDFTPHLDPSATLTYQAIVSANSLVFRIASFGEVEELVELFEKGIASLTDHDENGRSLLSYALEQSNSKMCKFLVSKKADVNAMEPNVSGYIGPVHAQFRFDDAKVGEIMRYEGAECYRIMLEAGADLSLEVDAGSGLWLTTFLDAIMFQITSLKHILDLGEPFINLSGKYKFGETECSALIILADGFEYDFDYLIYVIDKAILLLDRKADISCRDEDGNTVLHTILRSKRWHDKLSRKKASKLGKLQLWDLSFQTSEVLLMLFITAGADVYATNNNDKTPSMYASQYGREDEWIQALELCGYDSKEVLTSDIHHPTREHQTSKLSFHDYCEQWQRQRQQHFYRFEEVKVMMAKTSQSILMRMDPRKRTPKRTNSKNQQF